VLVVMRISRSPSAETTQLDGGVLLLLHQWRSCTTGRRQSVLIMMTILMLRMMAEDSA